MYSTRLSRRERSTSPITKPTISEKSRASSTLRISFTDATSSAMRSSLSRATLSMPEKRAFWAHANRASPRSSRAGFRQGARTLARQVEDALRYRFREACIMDRSSSVIHCDPEILSGAPVFVATRVPVRILFEYLAAGDSLDEFLDAFPSVRREQAVAVIELARDMMGDGARSPR